MDDKLGLLEERLQRVEDEHAIVQNIYTYCASLDQRRQAEWLDCFTEDAVLSFEPSAKVAEVRGRVRLEGRQQLSDFFVATEERARASSPKHVTVNSIVRVSGDEASAESTIVLFIDAGGVPELVSTGRYRDRLRRCADGRWRFCERIGYMDTLRPPLRSP